MPVKTLARECSLCSIAASIKGENPQKILNISPRTGTQDKDSQIHQHHPMCETRRP